MRMTEIGWDTNLSAIKPEQIKQWIANHREESPRPDDEGYALKQAIISFALWLNFPPEKRGNRYPTTLMDLPSFFDDVLDIPDIG